MPLLNQKNVHLVLPLQFPKIAALFANMPLALFAFDNRSPFFSTFIWHILKDSRAVTAWLYPYYQAAGPMSYHWPLP